MPRVGAGPSTIRFFGHASRPGTARGQSPQNWRYRMGRISGSSIKFLTDNEVWDVAAWVCESSCFANNPTQQIGSGLGELEIKPEPLRYIVCATRELLEDSSTNVEAWLFDKCNRAFRAQISARS